ncbi:Lateral signaling target protein 2 [Phytophthora cinnamomi]|uniref:Lateral signaling target protein 2 n=1 Tax=Phytophthora cinnamomi TaxID=4785 RepID=UPI00355A70AA|nr:Lateral signaling target protein 2 [Phytophthora cinnamomi]
MGVSVTACDSPLALSSPLAGKEQAGSPPQWRPDAASDSCLCCGNDFSIWTRRRHHCRACGELVCGECSPFYVRLPELGYKGRVRVCTHCHALADASLESSASAHSLTRLESAAASSESSDNEQLGDVEEELVFRAVDVLALTSRDKRSKLQYQYFVQSEAVSWLVDAGIMSSRTGCAALFLRLVDYGYVTLKPWNGSGRSAFYILSEEMTLENRSSHYDTAIHSETSKCRNCAQSFQKALAPVDGFCSIDCKTNALISQSDSAHIRRFCA